MAITATTLSGALTATQVSFGVASATGITAPNYQTGSGITVLFVDQEYMFVTAVVGTVVSVLRGQYGSIATSHLSGGQVQIGLPTDFPPPMEVIGTGLTSLQIEGALNWPATFLSGSADAIPAGVAGFYVVKTAGVNAMTLAAPTLAQEGNIIQIWSDTLNPHTLTATSLLANGTALKTTATFAAFRGAGLILRACNLVYHVMGQGGGTITGATCVLT